MARPKPTVITSYPERDRTIEICDCQAVYAVFYQGRPIKIRIRQQDMYDGFKYKKTSFPEAGHAVRLAQQLNQRFGTRDYSVVELKSGRILEV
jgi:hypothetical protein